MNQNNIEKLKTYHTRKLLSLLRGTYSGSGARGWGWDGLDWIDPPGYEPDFTEQEIRSVLATREHIPNKKEGRAIRQARHRMGKKERGCVYRRR